MLAQKIVQILTETGFPAERLVVEVTESSLFADIELARSIVASLKNARASASRSMTLARVVAFEPAIAAFDVIKIDRGFAATIHQDPSAAIVRAVTSLAKALDVPVTVES
jgi:EAL domain-containing protein (putative c-di-GMP-specific phosphodiesterase class I)